MSARAVCGCGWNARYASAALAEAFSSRHVCRQDDRIRRAARRHRCARCGFVATYDNAGAAEARYWFSKHSCRKRELAMLSTARGELRDALVDRTPQPCLHKVANHQHGERATYVLDRCRCIPCADANTKTARERSRLKAYGRYNRYVPGLPVREHIQQLRDAGMGLKTIAKQAGIATGTISKIVYGVYAPGTGGRNGKGDLVRAPSRRVLRTTAEAIYALDPGWSGVVPLAPGAKDPAGTLLARQRLQALVALGWSMSEIGRRIGHAFVHPGNACALFSETSRSPVMQRRTVDAANALFEQLSMTLPPESTPGQRISAARARNYARSHGWVPPLELDDEAYEQPGDATSTPASPGSLDIDEVAIQRRMNGDRDVVLNKDESVELVRRWRASGRPMNECGRVTGLKPERYSIAPQTPAGEQDEAPVRGPSPAGPPLNPDAARADVEVHDETAEAEEATA